MPIRIKRLIKSERGQSIVEFALVVPIFLFMITGVVDLSRAIYTQMQLNFLVQEAVRLGGTGSSDTEIADYVSDNFQGDRSRLRCAITPGQASRKPGDYMKVTVNYSMSYVTPLLSATPLSDVSVESTIRME
ncbi:TadE family protein [Paenibacillus sp.]|uniref:TadE/TadG family type IV pilus assembly protein n=1 Tax=Paenibacillus sp. TaxID=58172 RepID=UPI002D46386B|nr:TadE family protein [Paenibacillus sp.]HZG84288.1 TadE family protein [Paenibacillus sp.]